MALHGSRRVVVTVLATFPWACHTGPPPAASPVALTTLRGIVRDSSTGEPLWGASVRASYDKHAIGPSPALGEAVADSLGHFALSVPASGRLYLSARYIGYDPMVASVALPRDSARTVVLALPPYTTRPYEQKVAPSSTGRSQCRPPDEYAEALMINVKDLINPRFPGLAGLRDTVGLGGVDTSSVVLVTDRTTCARAASVLDSLANVRNSGRLVWVVRAGAQRYIVKDPDVTAGEWGTSWIFDSHFNYVAVILM
jgi:hypothetical protein